MRHPLSYCPKPPPLPQGSLMRCSQAFAGFNDILVSLHTLCREWAHPGAKVGRAASLRTTSAALATPRDEVDGLDAGSIPQIQTFSAWEAATAGPRRAPSARAQGRHMMGVSSIKRANALARLLRHRRPGPSSRSASSPPSASLQ